MIEKNQHKAVLKLVVNNLVEEDMQVDQETLTTPTQLNLFLNDEYHLVLIQEASINIDTFTDFLIEIKPRWIFDARPSPRLDILAGSRKEAFELFSEIDTNYISLYTRLKESIELSNEGSPWWIEPLATHFNKLGSFIGPSIFIADDNQIYDETVSHLETITPNIIPSNHSLEYIKYC